MGFMLVGLCRSWLTTHTTSPPAGFGGLSTRKPLRAVWLFRLAFSGITSSPAITSSPPWRFIRLRSLRAVGEENRHVVVAELLHHDIVHTHPVMQTRQIGRRQQQPHEGALLGAVRRTLQHQHAERGCHSGHIDLESLDVEELLKDPRSLTKIALLDDLQDSLRMHSLVFGELLVTHHLPHNLEGRRARLRCRRARGVRWAAVAGRHRLLDALTQLRVSIVVWHAGLSRGGCFG